MSEAGWHRSVSRKPRLSVALCTYNGERFLPQQLASIAQQTRLPDELVVSDDGSHDRTLTIIRDFAPSVSFPVSVFENQQQLGVAANFEQAIRACEGDLIALSDQDDIWYPERMQISEEVLMADPRVGLVFSDADLIDEEGEPLGQTLWQKLEFAGERRRALLERQYVLLAKHRFV